MKDEILKKVPTLPNKIFLTLLDAIHITSI